ncbi:MAG: hypothetical protein K0U98_17835 [Deltaproteobacteria bacterium]|nr:hypothetical protein [Deltaproteobacteria bacterium]
MTTGTAVVGTSFSPSEMLILELAERVDREIRQSRNHIKLGKLSEQFPLEAPLR